jgi:hypothetical protein
MKHSLEQLSKDFWEWRSWQQPRSRDDLPRLVRPTGWIPKWSVDDISQYKNENSLFLDRLNLIKVGSYEMPAVPKEEWIDHKLIHSAISRVTWELDYLRFWKTHPGFYVDQTIGSVFEYLLPLKVDEQTFENIQRLLKEFPRILDEGRENLAGNCIKEFTETTIKELIDIRDQLATMSRELIFNFPNIPVSELSILSQTASLALEGYREWLISELPNASPFEPLGADKFNWFLSEVALIPLRPEELFNIGEIELNRAIFLEEVHKNRYKNVTLPALPKSAIEQSQNEANLEAQVSKFYLSQGLLSQNSRFKRYLNAPRPKYLESIRWLGVTDDLTTPDRLDEDAIAYVPEPKPDMPYFYAANARDPRAGIAHEGAHYQQLVRSWTNPREVRRHYYDSGINEGIAFYNEELLLAAGLFADAPHSQTLLYNFMKLRAMRVCVDVSLVIGKTTIENATRYLAEKIPMDLETASEEAIFFASFPGQGMTYQIGKTQIQKLIADLVIAKGSEFNFQEFHDYLWENGNVPISLLRFELLNDFSDLGNLHKFKEEK